MQKLIMLVVRALSG